MKPMFEPISTFFSTMAAKVGVMALLGGLANAINARREGRSRTKGDFFLLWLMSAFFGLMVGFIALSIFKDNIYGTMAMSGTGGWLGIETTNYLKDWLYSKKTT